MDLERITVTLRLRNRWEAIDLGLQLARREFLTLWLLWWLSALPLSLLAMWLLRDHPGWIGTALWWFKPMFEPVMTLWLGRALFGERLPLRTAARHWWRVTRRRLLANLLWRRFSPNRSFLMPVTVLEQPDRRAWRERASILLRRYGGAAWLTVIGVHFEFVIAVGLVFGALMLVPTELLPRWEFVDWFDDGIAPVAWIWTVATLLAMSLFAPFYVAGGFALYLSRRTELEAWDIELNFKRIGQRLLQGSAVTMLVLAAALPLLVPQPAHAETGREQTGRLVAEILADPEFGSEKTVTRWRFRDTDREESEAKRWNLEGLADVLVVLAWLGVASLVAWVAVTLYRHREQFRVLRSREGRSSTLPPRLHRFAAAAADLPPDIAAAVRECLACGDVRAATALLYRASLSVLVHRHALQLGDSATEGQCLEQVRAQRPEGESEFFTRLTRIWIAVAYADRHPPGERIERLLEEWSVLYASKDTQT